MVRLHTLIVPAALSLFATACGQDIVVLECDDAHFPDAPNSQRDTGPTTNDGGVNDDAADPNRDATAGDATTRDADMNPPDGGPGTCGNSPYCIRDLMPSLARANVREAVTFTPQIDNPTGAALTFTAPEMEVTATRRAEFPALVMSDVDLNLTVDAQGVATFVVAEVPPWFTTTTFQIKVHARSAAGPDISATGTVVIRGNVLFSGYSSVYAVASDGRPARSINFTQGRLIEGSSFVSSPNQLLLARDGTLIVYDKGATPERLRRFELSGENVHLGDFDYEAGPAMPYITPDQDATGIGQLMQDGRIALPIYDFSRQGSDSAIVLWREDGTYDRTLEALNPTVRWQGMAASRTANELLVVERGSAGRLIRLNPDTGAEIDMIASDIAYAWSVIGMRNGNSYVGIDGEILRVTPQGGKTLVSGIMGSSADYWWAMSPFTDDRILAVRDTGSDSANITVVEGTMNLGWLRPAMVGGASTTPNGVVYLE